METETCSNCLEHIYYEGIGRAGGWFHLVTNEPECDDDSGCVAEPRM